MITGIEYERKLDDLADDCIANNRTTAKYLEKLLVENNTIAKELFEFRKFFVNKHDYECVKGFLSIGFLKESDEIERVTFFCLEFELEAILRRKRFVNLCREYDETQLVFEEEPSLLDHIRIKGSKKKKPENELVDYYALKQLHTSEIMKFQGNFVTISPFLNPRIPEWIAKNYSESPLYVKVNPSIISDKRIPQILTEELQINPHNINWLTYEFSENLIKSIEFKLENIELSQENQMEYWDSNIRKIKTLQISTSYKDTYRSFMLEELNDKLGNDGILIGRCIHLDSLDFDETDLDNQNLNHLDLAINVYENENRKKSLSESLKNGKITDADFRTHILRVDNISIKTLPVFCQLFFNSPTLTEKYMKYILKKTS